MVDPRTVSRRSFMRRMVGASVGLLSLEFIGASVAFLWPTKVEGLGIAHEVGTLEQIEATFPAWATGEPIEFLGEKLELGPAPRGMARFPVRFSAAGVVIVDTHELIEGPPKGTVSFVDRFPPDVGCQ